MTKRLQHDITYAAPAGVVVAMLANPAFREEVCTYQGVLRSTVSVESDDERTEVIIDLVHGGSSIPSFAKRFVGDEINIVQTESWSTATEGDIHVAIPGKPGEMSGTLRLTESAGTTTQRVDLTIRVGIPLVGGKIEGLISDLLLRALKAENKVGIRYLLR